MSNHSCDCCCTCKEKEITPRMVKFDKGGIYEWKVPKNAWYEVTVTGAGGAGGSAMITAAPEKGFVSIVGGSGGAGGTAQKNLYLVKDTIIPIKVGNGGENTKSKQSWINFPSEPAGEESYFGNHCLATGGNGGQSIARSQSMARRTGNSGVGKNGDMNIFGGNASAACINKNFVDLDLHFFSSGCSPSIYGGGGNRSFVSSNGQNGINGAGGEGAVAQLWSDIAQGNRDLNMVNKPFYGGNGGDGVVVIKWFEFQ